MTREEAIQVLKDIKRIRSTKITEAIDMAIEALSVDRPSGEWLKKDEYHLDSIFEIECNQCGSGMWQSRNEEKYPNYCYNCGARMEETK